MPKVPYTFPFLEDSAWSGAVEVLETEDSPRQVHLIMRVGKMSVRLPRRGLSDILNALTQAKYKADEAYSEILRSMNPQRK